MDLSQFEKLNADFLFAINQNRFLSLVANELLGSFPFKLPDELKSKIKSEIDILTSEGGSPDVISSITESFIFMTGADVLRNDQSSFASGEFFRRSILAQELVMLFAHLDALMIDSLQIIYIEKPEMLKSNSEMTYRQIIETGSWEKLLDEISKKKLFSFGLMPVKKRLKLLDDKHGLKVILPSDSLDQIHEASKIRNLIVHNGGKVSEEFLKIATNSKGLVIGELVPLSTDYLQTCYRNIRLLGANFNKSLKTKYFG